MGFVALPRTTDVASCVTDDSASATTRNAHALCFDTSFVPALKLELVLPVPADVGCAEAVGGRVFLCGCGLERRAAFSRCSSETRSCRWRTCSFSLSLSVSMVEMYSFRRIRLYFAESLFCTIDTATKHNGLRARELR